MKSNPERTEMTTMTSCLTRLQSEGYAENFMVNEYGLHGLNTEKYYSPSEVKVTNFFRFEGESDPGDSSILYAIETQDGLRGTLTDSFGPYADDNTGKFMKEVEEITKKTGTVNSEEKVDH